MITDRSSKQRRLFSLLPTSFAVMILGVVIWAYNNPARQDILKARAEIDAITQQIAKVNVEATEVEDIILAKMKRGIPVHPVGNSPASEQPFKERAVKAMLAQMDDPRPAVSRYAFHDLSRIRFTPEDREWVLPLLKPRLGTPKYTQRYINLIARFEPDLADLRAYLLEVLDRETYSNFSTITLNLSMKRQPQEEMVPIYLERMRHSFPGEEVAKQLLHEALMRAYFFHWQLEETLAKAIDQTNDEPERARLEKWRELLQGMPKASYPRPAIKTDDPLAPPVIQIE